MNDEPTSGPRKTPEAEKKFGMNLRARLHSSTDESVDVIIATKEQQDSLKLVEKIASTLNDDIFVEDIGGTILRAIVNPPDVRSKLASIASNDEVHLVTLNEPFMPPTIPKSYFQ